MRWRSAEGLSPNQRWQERENAACCANPRMPASWPSDMRVSLPMQNYVEGNRWMTGGLQYRIGQSLEGSLLYLYFDGARNALQDRDNVQISLSYTF